MLNAAATTLRRPGGARRPPVGGGPLESTPGRCGGPAPGAPPPGPQNVVGAEEGQPNTRAPDPVQLPIAQAAAAKLLMGRHALLEGPPVARVLIGIRRPRPPLTLLLVTHQLPPLGAPDGLVLNEAGVTHATAATPPAHEAVPGQRRMGPPQPPLAPPLSLRLGQPRHPLGAPPPPGDLNARATVPRVPTLVRPRRAGPGDGPLLARPLIGAEVAPVPTVTGLVLGAAPPRTVPAVKAPPTPLGPRVLVVVLAARPRPAMPRLALPIGPVGPPVLRLPAPEVARRIAAPLPDDAAAPRVTNPNALTGPRLPKVQVLEARPPPGGRPIGGLVLHKEPRPRLPVALPLVEPTVLDATDVLSRPVLLLRLVLEVSGRLPRPFAGPPMRRIPHPRPTRVRLRPTKGVGLARLTARHTPVIGASHGEGGLPIPLAKPVQLVITVDRGRREAVQPPLLKPALINAQVLVPPARGAAVLVPLAALPPLRWLAKDQIAVARTTTIGRLAELLPLLRHAAHAVLPTDLLAKLRRRAVPPNPAVKAIERRTLKHPTEPDAAPVGPVLDRGLLPASRTAAGAPPQVRGAAGADVAAPEPAANAVVHGVGLTRLPAALGGQRVLVAAGQTARPRRPRAGPPGPGTRGRTWRPGAGRGPPRGRTGAVRVGPPHLPPRARAAPRTGGEEVPRRPVTKTAQGAAGGAGSARVAGGRGQWRPARVRVPLPQGAGADGEGAGDVVAKRTAAGDPGVDQSSGSHAPADDESVVGGDVAPPGGPPSGGDADEDRPPAGLGDVPYGAPEPKEVHGVPAGVGAGAAAAGDLGAGAPEADEVVVPEAGAKEDRGMVGARQRGPAVGADPVAGPPPERGAVAGAQVVDTVGGVEDAPQPLAPRPVRGKARAARRVAGPVPRL